MGPASRHRDQTAYQQLSAEQAAALVASARDLQRAAADGHRQPLLRGKNLGLLCPDDRAFDATLFRRAATELGAHVAHIRPSFGGEGDGVALLHTARLLGRLYDAVECEGLPHALVEQIAAEAGVPVFDGLAQPDHPTAALADELGDGATPGERRCYVLQALLLRTIV